MSQQELVHQAVVYGNPFEAIELNIFSCTEYVDYLSIRGNDLPKERLYLAFCALMKNYPSVYHYCQGQHILSYLTKDSFLNRIFLILGGSPELPIGKEDNNSLWSLLFDEYSDFVSDAWSEEIEKAMLLCDKITPKLAKRIMVFEDVDFIKTLYEYRCEKVLSKYPKPSTFYYLSVDTDWFGRYPIVKKHYAKFIQRIEYLQKNAPLYYDKVHHQFLSLFSELTLREFERLDNDLLKRTCSCFPDQFSNLSIKDEFQKISIYPIPIRAYILGLSLYPKIPHVKEVDQALLKLSQLGIEKYVEDFIENQTREKYPEEKIANSEDTLFETPENYSDFDCLNIEENGKIYQFTRPEFAKLLSDKKNFWTKQPIPFSDLYSIQVRINMAKVLNLPNPETIRVLIEKASKGTLYEDSLTQSNNNQGQQVPIHPDPLLTQPSSLLSSVSLVSLPINATSGGVAVPVTTGSSASYPSSSFAYSIDLLNNPNISSHFSNSLIQLLQEYMNDPAMQNYMSQYNLNQVGTGGFVNESGTNSNQQRQDEESNEESNAEQDEDDEPSAEPSAEQSADETSEEGLEFEHHEIASEQQDQEDDIL
jgi:hypothetical protein